MSGGKNKNKLMQLKIINWGIPECLKEDEENIIFKFDDDGLINTRERGYHYNDGDVKFCLFDKKAGTYT